MRRLGRELKEAVCSDQIACASQTSYVPINFMQKEAFERTGLIPRSIIRTFDRFLQQLLPGSESVALQEYLVSRYQILVSIQSVCILVCIPVLVNYAVKSFLLMPLTEHLWNSGQKQIFLNRYQEKRAFAEMQDFSEKIFFESLLSTPSKIRGTASNQSSTLHTSNGQLVATVLPAVSAEECLFGEGGEVRFDQSSCADQPPKSTVLQIEEEEYTLQKRFQLKSLQVASKYNQQSILAITNICTDLTSLLTLYLLSMLMKPQIIILKSFVIESIYSLSDTTKSFLLILVMDLLVGFHSPHGWEIAVESLLRHFGLPENESFILFFVALFPVSLDTVFKYWIFRYLNKISPSTVVTYHSMIE